MNSIKEKIQRSWDALHAHRQQRGEIRITDLFKQDSKRFDSFRFQMDDQQSSLLLDYSKCSICPTARQLLIDLVDACGLEQKKDDLLNGKIVNQSEQRPALHTALRASEKQSLVVDGEDLVPTVLAGRAQMLEFAEQCRAEGKFKNIVNIGIGGSDLGPAMATAALSPDHNGPTCYFVSNMDGAHLADIISKLNPLETMFIISSKTFSTLETMTNFQLAHSWLAACPSIGTQHATNHIVAVSAAIDRVQQSGIKTIFKYENWVGGRYSMWGPVGLPLALAIGAKKFQQLLDGARSMDENFRSAPILQNLPTLLALSSIWHRNICGIPTRAVLPYDQRLHLLPAYLQQLDMESNGKSVTQAGQAVALETSPVVWGTVGTNNQHAYFQMLHQGTDLVACEFLIAANARGGDQHSHQLLVANCIAQSAALMQGDINPEKSAYQHYQGNRPSVTLMYKQLDAYTLGQLISLFEHRTFVEGVVWGINSFDQWGVELGKQLANQMASNITANSVVENIDASSQGLLDHYRKLMS